MARSEQVVATTADNMSVRTETQEASKRRSMAVLVSGGLDSSVLLAELVCRGNAVQPIYVRSGLRWEAVERYWLRRFLRALRAPRLQRLTELTLPVSDVYGAHWSISGKGTPGYDAPLDSNYLPGRNLLLLSKAAVFCAQHDIAAIALAVLRDNPFADGTPEFFRRFAATARCAFRVPFEVRTPFRRLSKSAVIRRAQSLPLHLTFSCVQPSGRLHCGTCTKCAERKRGFQLAGVLDPTRYGSRPRG
jgi:7-cyano-7-deazaguanine synthase